MPVKWGNGIIHEAKWINDGPVPVNFGPTSDDEMMVLIAFYTEQPVTIATNEPGSELAEGKILVIPNPTNGNATLTLPEGSEGVRTFRLFNLIGQEVLRRNDISGQSFDLDLSLLAPGVYFFDADGRVGKLQRN